MTVPEIDLSSQQLEPGSRYRTNDGKLVTVKEVCVEEFPPHLDISNIVKGDILLLRSGERFTYTGEQRSCGDTFVFRGESKQYQFWFWADGRCRPFGPERDVVEIIKGKRPIVSLEGLQVGDCFRARDGELFTCIALDDYGSPILAKSKKHGMIYFKWTGHSNMPHATNLEAVERLTPSVFEQIKRAVKSLGEENVEKVVMNKSDWLRIQEEVYTPEGSGVYIGNVRILHSADEFAHPKGRLDIRLKFE